MYIANKAGSGLLNGSSSMEHRRSFCFGYSKNISAVPKQKLRLCANLIGLFFEMPYLPYTQLSDHNQNIDLMSGGDGFMSNMQSTIRNNKNQLRDKKALSSKKRNLDIEQKETRPLTQTEKDQLKDALNTRRKQENRKLLLILAISFVIAASLIIGFLNFV